MIMHRNNKFIELFQIYAKGSFIFIVNKIKKLAVISILYYN